MATILAHIKVREGHEAAFETLAQRLYEGTHANESNVLAYQYWRGAEPSTYYTLLAFPDHQTFITHQTSAHHEEFSDGLGDIVERIKLEWVDPIAGASPFPPTNEQPAPDGADETTRSTTTAYAAVVAEWWQAHRAQ